MKNVQSSGKSIKKKYGRKYTLESKLIQFRKTQIIFVMLSTFLTGNFSDPFISTGTHFINFCPGKYGPKEK